MTELELKTSLDYIESKLVDIERKIDDIDPPGHFIVIVLLLLIAFEIGAC